MDSVAQDAQCSWSAAARAQNSLTSSHGVRSLVHFILPSVDTLSATSQLLDRLSREEARGPPDGHDHGESPPPRIALAIALSAGR